MRRTPGSDLFREFMQRVQKCQGAWLRYRIERYGALKFIVGIDREGCVREVVYPENLDLTVAIHALVEKWGTWRHEIRFLSADEFVEELEKKLALLKELVRKEG